MKNLIHDLLVFFSVCIFVLFITIKAPAKAHSWYPPECCSDQDCAEVIKTIELPNGDLEVTSKHGTVLITKKTPRKQSLDNKEHVCMLPNYEEIPVGYKHFVVCYFVPMGS